MDSAGKSVVARGTAAATGRNGAGRHTWLVLLPALVWGIACEPESETPQAGVEPAVSPTTAEVSPAPPGAEAVEAKSPLPGKALLALDELEPPIEAPKNKPGVREPTDRTRDLVAEAEAMLAKNDFDGARDRLERAAGFSPDNARILRNLGLAYAGLRNSGRATDLLRKALKDAPDDLQVQVLLGDLAAAQKQYDEATLRLRTALKCSEFRRENPWAAEALYLLAQVLQRQGYWQGALECHDRLYEWMGDPGEAYASRPALKRLLLRPEQLLTERGELLLRLRRSPEAAKVLRRAFRRDRTDKRTARLLVDAYLATADYVAAEKLLGEMTAEPSQRAALPELADRVCRAARDKDMPGRIWRAYRERNRTEIDVGLAAALAKIAQSIGGVAEAAAILEPVIREAPGNAEFGLLLSRLYVRQGKVAAAVAVLARMIAANPALHEAVLASAGEIAAALKPGDATRLAQEADADDTPLAFARHYVAGLLAERRGKGFLAADQHEKALAKKPDFLPAYAALADLHLSAGRSDRAERIARRLRELDEEHYLAYFIQGKARLRRRDTDGAIDALLQARNQRPQFIPASVLLSWAYERDGKPGDAEAALQAALTRQREDPRLNRLLFDRYLTRRRERAAVDLVARLLRADRDSLLGRLLRAELALHARDANQAKEIHQDLRGRAGESLDVELLGLRIATHPSQGLLPRKEYLKRVRRLQEIVRNHPENRTAGRLLAQVLLQADQTAAAADVLGELTKAVPEDLTVEKAHLAALMLAGRYGKSLSLAEALVKEGPQELWARGAVIDALRAMERYDEAARRLEAWLDDEAETSRVFWHRFKLLETHERAEQYDAAQTLLDRWVEADPEHAARLRGNKVRLYMAAEQKDRAVEYAKQWIAEAPEDPQARALLVDVLVEAKAYEAAIPLLRKWIGGKTDESVLPYRTMLAVALVSAGKEDKAREYVEDWIGKSKPYDLTPRRALIGALVSADKHAVAIATGERWLKEFAAAEGTTRPAGYEPTVRWCRDMLVSALLLQREYEKALKRADAFLAKDSKHVELHNLRSTALAELGRADDAMAALENAYKLAPDDPSTNNNLGYYYADRGLRLDESEKMLRKALAKAPGQVAFQDSLAWIFYKQGKVRKAGAIFNELVGRKDGAEIEHPVIHDHAGDAYWRLGWREKARARWEAALRLAKEGEDTESREVREVRKAVERKLEAARKGRPVPVAPLGEGVTEHDGQQ